MFDRRHVEYLAAIIRQAKMLADADAEGMQEGIMLVQSCVSDMLAAEGPDNYDEAEFRRSCQI